MTATTTAGGEVVGGATVVVVVVGGTTGTDCHARALTPPTVVVTRVGPVPSVSITQTSATGASGRLLANAMRVPSGDHDGPKSNAGLLVMLVCPLPSAPITKTS